eukprot:TRINITY_DN8878_c0_g2_i2.p1 TRINITY_DN8878_c0_g2~~TRINITY_DN8878_c0_g2_i2.p1  ORF type:complete len:120 (-),score=17.54 TRINITY_DN8878_c0_g2_i2:563-922(-)
MVFPLPKSTIKAMESLCRKFLWSSSDQKTQSNLIAWDTICLPKYEGGLSLRRMAEVNEACSLKLAWKAMLSSSLWASWFRARVLQFQALWSAPSEFPSYIGKRRKALASILHKNSIWNR